MSTNILVYFVYKIKSWAAKIDRYTFLIKLEYGNTTIEPTSSPVTAYRSTSSVCENDTTDTTTEKEGNNLSFYFHV